MAIAAALVALVTTTGAWADFEQNTRYVPFSADLFGVGSDAIELDPDGSAVLDLIVDADIPVGDRGEITITITNGTFASAVPLSSLSVIDGAGSINPDIVAGGTAGSSSVTFEVIVVTDPVTEGLRFTLPPVTGVAIATPASIMTIGATVDDTTTTAGFPTEVEDGDFDNSLFSDDCASGVCPILGALDPYLDDPGPPATSQFSVNDGDTSLVDILDRDFLGPIAVDVTDTTGATDVDLRALRVATHTFNLGPATLQRDGSNWDNGPGEDGFGTITVTVNGDFRPGDKVFIEILDPGPGLEINTGEEFTISGQTATFSNVALTGPTGVLGAALDIYYVANGTDDLSPTTFAAHATINYAVSTNVARETAPQRDPGEIRFQGINVKGYAYAIPKASASDRGFARVKNESSSPANVFMDCEDDAGNSAFADLGALTPNQTRAYDSQAIETGLGQEAVGRWACDVLSEESSSLSVQMLTRSGGVLVNNSEVIGRSRTPDAGPF